MEYERPARAEPLVTVQAVYDSEWSEYPDAIRVPMDNGHVVTYRIDMELPNPAFLTAMATLKSMVGYPKKRRHRKA